MEILTHDIETNDVLYTVPQVAKIFKCNPKYVRNLIRSGALKAIRLGEVKITSKEIESFLDRNNGMDLNNPFDIKPFNYG